MSRKNAITIELSHLSGDPNHVRCEVSFGAHQPEDWENTPTGVIASEIFQRLHEIGIIGGEAIKDPEDADPPTGGRGHA